MNTTYWSRRRVIGALAATTAVAATSSLVLSSAPAEAATTAPPDDLDEGDPFNLPDTDRAKAVKAWLLGGKAVRAAAESVLIGSDTDVQTFLTVDLPKATAEDNRVAILTLAGGGRAPGARPPRRWRAVTPPSPSTSRAASRPPSWKT